MRSDVSSPGGDTVEMAAILFIDRYNRDLNKWNISHSLIIIVEPLYKGHLSNEDTVRSHNQIELYINLPLK